MKKGKRMTKLAAIIACIAIAFSMATVGVLAAEEEKKEFAFAPFAENSFTNFAWGSSMTKELSTEHSKDENSSLKVTKSEAMADSGAAVYYQNFGGSIAAMEMENNLGISFYIYLESPMENSYIGCKFQGMAAGKIESQADGGAVEDGASLNFTGFKKFIVTYPADAGFDPATKNELEIAVHGGDNGTVYISKLSAIYTGTASGDTDPNPPSFDELGAKKLQISGFNTQDEFALWNISGASGTTYTKSLNTDASKVSEGTGSLKYTWSNHLYSFGWTEIYLDVTELIEHNKDAGLKGISFSLQNMNIQPVGEVGFWVKLAEKDGSEYEVNAGMLKTGTKLDFTDRKTIEVPFSAATILQTYTTDENDRFDGDQLAFIKIGIWSSRAELVDVEMYIDDLVLTADRELSLPGGGGDEPGDKPGDQPGGDTPGDETPGKIQTWVWVLIGVGSAVLIAGGGVLLYFFVIKKKK